MFRSGEQRDSNPMPIILSLETLCKQGIELCGFLGFCSGVVKVPIVLGCGGMSLGDWCLMILGHFDL
jgi:hypothetical protein